MWGQSSWLCSETSPWRSCSSCRIEKAQEGVSGASCANQAVAAGTGQGGHREGVASPLEQAELCEDFTRSETGPVPPAQLLTLSPLVVLGICPCGSLWMCWDIPQPVLAPQYCWQELLELLLYSWRCSWSQSCCPGRTWPPLCSAVCPPPHLHGMEQQEMPKEDTSLNS